MRNKSSITFAWLSASGSTPWTAAASRWYIGPGQTSFVASRVPPQGVVGHPGNVAEMLPTFRYHPDPIATGSVKASDAACMCCGQARGYVYTGSVFGPGGLREKLCPWCIASGSAASKYNCSFSDDRPLRKARLDRPIVLEVSRKTPGYSSWQQGEWQVCCGDACEFHGDASKQQLVELAGDRLAWHLRRWRWDAHYWRQFVEAYDPCGMMSVFHFVCRQCGEPTYALDLG